MPSSLSWLPDQKESLKSPAHLKIGIAGLRPKEEESFQLFCRFSGSIIEICWENVQVQQLWEKDRFVCGLNLLLLLSLFSHLSLLGNRSQGGNHPEGLSRKSTVVSHQLSMDCSSTGWEGVGCSTREEEQQGTGWDEGWGSLDHGKSHQHDPDGS